MCGRTGFEDLGRVLLPHSRPHKMYRQVPEAGLACLSPPLLLFLTGPSLPTQDTMGIHPLSPTSPRILEVFRLETVSELKGRSSGLGRDLGLLVRPRRVGCVRDTPPHLGRRALRGVTSQSQ